jgi:hypothetical protein
MNANALFHDVVCRLYTHKCNFIYTHYKRVAFSAPVLMRPTNGQQRYVQISYTRFHAKQAIRVESKDENSFYVPK